MIKNVSRSLIVDVTVERAYEIWSDFAGLPSLLRNVEQVRVEGRRLRWLVRREEWEALTAELVSTQQVSGHRINGHRINGQRLHAVVSMSPTDDRRTKVTLGAEYEVPPGEPDDKGARYEQVLRGFKRHADAVRAAGPGKRAGAIRTGVTGGA